MMAATPDSAFDAHEAPTLREGDDPRPGRRSLLILVVDDDSDMREMHCVAVGQLGHRTLACSNGREAVLADQRYRPDVILMDVAMPELDGIEATRLIKADRTDVFIVVMTAYGDQRYFDAAFDAGCDAFLCKPFNPFVLGDMIDAYCRRRDMPIVKTCGCGKSYTIVQWSALPYVGAMGDTELRNCHCGSSLALTVDRPSEA
jgi:CheY-like chemotaxis protein